MFERNEILESAQAYHENGIQVIPVKSGTKKPEGYWKQYQEKYIPKNEIPKLFSGDHNIAGLGGAVSSCLSVLDVDDYRKFENTVWKKSIIRDIWNETWVGNSASGRPHLYLRTPFPLRSRNDIKTTGIEVRGEGQYFLMPPSIFNKNGQGFLYCWNHGPAQGKKIVNVSEGDLELISKILPIERFNPSEKKSSELKPFGMNWKAFEILCLGKYEEHGFAKNGSPSYSEAEFHAIRSLASLGWSDYEIRNFVLERAHEKSNFRTRESKTDYLDRTIKSVRKWIEKNRGEHQRELNRLRESVSVIDWNTLSGNKRKALTDKLTYSYILEAVARTGKGIVNHEGQGLTLPVREIAERTGRSKMTISSSLKRLNNNLIVQVQTPDLIHGSQYKIITCDTIRQSLYPPNCERLSNNVARSDELSNDAFRRGRVGESLEKTGMLVLNALEGKLEGLQGDFEGWFRKRDVLVVLTQYMTTRTFERKIGILEGLEVVRRKREGKETLFKLIGVPNLGAIARAIGSDGKGERQRRQHKLDREFEKDIRGLTPEEKAKARRERKLKQNTSLTRISKTEFLNPKTGEIHEV